MKSPLVVEDLEEFNVTKERVEEVTKTVEENIPSAYIPIKLPSNGRIEGVPKVLHFRDYSASEALDINTPRDEDRPKAIANVLKKMCFEKVNIVELPIQDILYILYVIQATFINGTLEKEIYLDEDLKGDELELESNKEIVDIPISSLKMTYLGKNEDDEDLERKIKVPFTVTDNKTKDKVTFKFTCLKDTITAQNYCKEFYHDEFLKFSPIRKDIDEFQNISNKEKRLSAIDKYMSEHYEECNEYYNFMMQYELMVAKVLQSLQIVSFNDEVCDTLDKCWDVYSNHLSANIWKTYNKIVSDFPFGINEKVEVYSSKLKKKLTRTIGFQLSDFIQINDSEDDERYCVSFD